MKSKIKEVVRISEPWGDFNTLFHSLIMENGDKIEIGKVKTQQVGWELDYEWKDDDDQQEFRKAKTPKKDFKSSNQPTGDNLKGIKIGHALNCASVLFSGAGDSLTDEQIEALATRIYRISEKMNNEL